MENEENMTSLWAIFVRVYWMMIGPLTLAMLGFTIIQIGSGWMTWADGVYLGVLVGMLYARWSEFHAGRAMTSDGKPASALHWRRYVQQVASIGFGVWIVANVIGNHVLGR